MADHEVERQRRHGSLRRRPGGRSAEAGDDPCPRRTDSPQLPGRGNRPVRGDGDGERLEVTEVMPLGEHANRLPAHAEHLEIPAECERAGRRLPVRSTNTESWSRLQGQRGAGPGNRSGEVVIAGIRQVHVGRVRRGLAPEGDAGGDSPTSPAPICDHPQARRPHPILGGHDAAGLKPAGTGGASGAPFGTRTTIGASTADAERGGGIPHSAPTRVAAMARGRRLAGIGRAHHDAVLPAGERVHRAGQERRPLLRFRGHGDGIPAARPAWPGTGAVPTRPRPRARPSPRSACSGPGARTRRGEWSIAMRSAAAAGAAAASASPATTPAGHGPQRGDLTKGHGNRGPRVRARSGTEAGGLDGVEDGPPAPQDTRKTCPVHFEPLSAGSGHPQGRAQVEMVAGGRKRTQKVAAHRGADGFHTRPQQLDVPDDRLMAPAGAAAQEQDQR